MILQNLHVIFFENVPEQWYKPRSPHNTNITHYLTKQGEQSLHNKKNYEPNETTKRVAWTCLQQRNTTKAWQWEGTGRKSEHLSSVSNEVKHVVAVPKRPTQRPQGTPTQRKEENIVKANHSTYTDAGRRDPQDDAFRKKTPLKCCCHPSERLGFHPGIQDQGHHNASSKVNGIRIHRHCLHQPKLGKAFAHDPKTHSSSRTAIARHEIEINNITNRAAHDWRRRNKLAAPMIC